MELGVTALQSSISSPKFSFFNVKSCYNIIYSIIYEKRYIFRSFSTIYNADTKDRRIWTYKRLP